MTFASLRFSDLRDVAYIWFPDAAIGGMGLNPSDREDHITNWEAPEIGLVASGEWFRHLRSFRKPGKQT